MTDPHARRQWLGRLVLGGLGLGSVATGAWFWHRQQALSPAATAVWQAEFARLDGQPLVMREYRGRPLLLNFWATWCPPCVKELPDLARFQQEHADWQVLAVAVDQASAVREFLASRPLQLTLGLAGLTGLDLCRTLGNSQGGLPFSVALDRRGELFWRKTGATELAELRAMAATLR